MCDKRSWERRGVQECSPPFNQSINQSYFNAYNVKTPARADDKVSKNCSSTGNKDLMGFRAAPLHRVTSVVATPQRAMSTGNVLIHAKAQGSAAVAPVPANTKTQQSLSSG